MRKRVISESESAPSRQRKKEREARLRDYNRGINTSRKERLRKD